MPTLGNALDFAKYEARNIRGHQLGAAPSSPVTGQLYYNTADNTLYWWDGSGWVSARGGASATPPATTGALGTIQLAGDLAGTATSPQIAAGVITDAEVAAANKDGAVGTASMRTLGSSAVQAMPGNQRLDFITAPGAALGMNGQRITNLADPTAVTDAANKQYVDAVAQGLAPKDSVRCATTATITIATALNSGDVIDGITLVNGDRVLVKNQSVPAENGLYVVAASPVRATDADAWSELPSAFVFVEEGTTNADSAWVCTSNQGGTLNTTAVTWAQFGSATAYTAGAGLTLTVNDLAVGAGPGITVNADTVQVANNGITNAMLADGAVDLASADVTNTLPIAKGGTGATTAAAARTALGDAGYYSSATHGAGTTITITAATHGLRATRGLIVQTQLESDGSILLADVTIAANGDVTITFGVSQTANTIRVTIIG